MRDGKRDVVDCARSCARGEESGFRIVVTVINVDTSSLRTIPSYELKNDSTLQSMFAEHGSARRRGALRRAAMDFTYIFSQRGVGRGGGDALAAARLPLRYPIVARTEIFEVEKLCEECFQL